MIEFFKRFKSKFFIDDRGAVSLYLIIVTLLLFLFNAVLIDYARILIAERQTEEAAKVALRSTMSSYHQGLQDKGLFAFDGDQEKANRIFKEVFEKNLQAGEGTGFDYLGLESVDGEISTNLNLERSLSHEDILKYQILEEMKYKAPIEIAEALIESFLSLSTKMEQASEYADQAKDLNKDAKKREGKLDKAEEHLNDASDLMDSIDEKVNGTFRDDYPNVYSISDIRGHRGEYRKYYVRQRDNKKGDDDYPSEDEIEKADYFKNESELLVNEIIHVVELAEFQLGLALDLIKDAEKINNEIKQKIEDWQSSGDYDDAKQIRDQFSDEDDGAIDEETIGTVEDYVIDKEFFTELISEIEVTIYKIDKKNGQTDSLLPKLKHDLKREIENNFHNSIHRHVENIQEYYNEVDQHIEEAIDIMENDRGEFNEAKDEIKEKEGEADDALDDNKDEFDELKELIDSASVWSSDTEKLKQLGIEARRYGEANKANQQEFSMEDREDTADEAMSFIDLLFKNIGNILLNARDELYINEYILMRFPSHDFGKKESTANSFENNQVEYIIYGLELHGANYFAALSEIFAVRFAINLVYGLMEPKSKIFGPFAWIASLAIAFTKTAEDMHAITNGESIRIYPKLRKPVMNYKDHLRLFLLTHPTGGKYRRLMAVIGDQAGPDLAESTTYVSAEASSSIKLWFLPQVVSLLDKTNVIKGRVEGNQYFIEKEVHYSY